MPAVNKSTNKSENRQFHTNDYFSLFPCFVNLNAINIIKHIRTQNHSVTFRFFLFRFVRQKKKCEQVTRSKNRQVYTTDHFSWFPWMPAVNKWTNQTMTNSIRVIIVMDSHDLPISTQSSTFVNAYSLVKDWVYEEMFFDQVCWREHYKWRLGQRPTAPRRRYRTTNAFVRTSRAESTFLAQSGRTLDETNNSTFRVAKVRVKTKPTPHAKERFL